MERENTSSIYVHNTSIVYYTTGLPPRFYPEDTTNGKVPPPPSYDDVTSGQPLGNPRGSRGSAFLEGRFENPLASIEEDALPPLTRGVSNPLNDYTNFDDIDDEDFDDHLFDALDQIELNDEEPDIGEDLEVSVQAVDNSLSLGDYC